MEDFYKVIGAVGFTVALIAGAGAYNALVLTYLWGWFVTPTFEFMPPVTWLPAWGLWLVFGFINSRYTKGDIKMGMLAAQAITTPTLFWGIGAILHAAT